MRAAGRGLRRGVDTGSGRSSRKRSEHSETVADEHSTVTVSPVSLNQRSQLFLLLPYIGSRLCWRENPAKQKGGNAIPGIHGSWVGAGKGWEVLEFGNKGLGE